MDQPVESHRRGRERGIANRADHRTLDHRIGEQFAGQPRDFVAAELPLNQKAGRRGDGQILGQSQFGGVGRDRARGAIGLPLGRINVNFPQHRELPLPRSTAAGAF